MERAQVCPRCVHRLIGVLVLALVAGSCGPSRTVLPSHTFRGPTMGTSFMVTVVEDGSQGIDLEEVRQVIEDTLEHIDAKMSHYRDDSELSRFNRALDTTPFEVSLDTFEVFRHAVELGALTDGAFDITVGPLVDAWGFGPSLRSTDPPSDARIGQLRAHLGYQKLDLDVEALTVRKRDPLLSCDLSAIAKGYAVDRVADAVEANGFTRYMIEVGGEVRTGGANESGEAWRIAIERPTANRRAIHRVIPLRGLAMATSGDYRNTYQLSGRWISHTVDPRTGYPVEHDLASVTVVDEQCVRADGLATALAVLGPDDGYRFALAHDIAAVLLVRNGEGGFDERVTPAFERLVD